MAIQIFIHEPGIGLVDQTGRIYDGGSLSQVYSLVRGQVGSGGIDFSQLPGDTYTVTKGSQFIVHEIVDSVDHVVFRGFVMSVERTWKDRANRGGYIQTLTIASVERRFSLTRIPPRFFAAGTKWGAVVTALFNALGTGFGLTLGTIEDGEALIGDLALRWSDTLESIFAQAAAASGKVWGVKHDDGTLYFQATTTTPAPYEVTTFLLESGDFTEDLSDYRNRQLLQISFQAFNPSIIVFAGGDGNQTQFIPYHYDSIYAAFLTTSTQATVTGSFLGIPADGDTFSISGPGQTNDPYTWKTTIDNTLRNQVLIGDTEAHCAQNAVDAINANPATAGAKYSWPTWENPLCNADAPAGSPIGFTLRVKLPGEGGNSIAVSETHVSSPGSFAWGAANPSGGADGSNTDLNVGLYSSGAGAGAPGADVQYTVGANALFLTAPIIAGWSLVVAYYRLGADTIVVEDSIEVAARAAVEGTDGLYTAFLTDGQQMDPYTGYQQALAYLNAYKQIPKTLKFIQDRALLSPGQWLQILVANPPDAPTLINANYLVQEVQAEYVPGLSKKEEPYGHFRYTVTAISVPEIQTFIDHNRQPLKLTHPQPPQPISVASATTPTPALKATTQTSQTTATGAPTQGTPTGTPGQQWVQEHLGLAILQSGDDLVMATSSTVSSASYSFQSGDAGGVLVIDASSGWTAGEYPITSVSGGIATITGTPAISGATGGLWGLGGKGALRFTWVPSKSTYTNNQVAIVTRGKVDSGSPQTITARVLTPFAYASVGYNITPIDGNNGPDYSITGNTLTLRDPLGDGEFVKAEYFPSGPAVPVKKAGDHSGSGPQFIAVAFQSSGSEQIMVSANGSTWTAVSSPLDGGAAYCIATDGAGVIVALGQDSGGISIAIRSTDHGATWTSHSIPQPQNPGPFSSYPELAFGAGTWVSVESDSSVDAQVIQSTDGGVTWSIATTITQPHANTQWDCITFGAGIFVIGGSCVSIGFSSHELFATASDPASWSITTTTPSEYIATGIAYDGSSTWVASDNSGADVLTSSAPGTDWTRRTSGVPSGIFWTSAAFGAGLFVVVGFGPSGVMTSAAGTSWAQQSVSDASSCNRVRFVHSTFVLCCADVPIITSSDGSTFTSQTAPLANVVDVTYG